jgi:hypothetical protein
MFTWIILARRPLKRDELQEAIAFTVEDQEWDASKIPSDIMRLIRACGNLVLIDEETNNIQLAHYTVQQYLLDRQSLKTSAFHVDAGESNWRLAEICAAYLSFSDFETQITKYSDATTPTLTTLSQAIVTQTILPQNSMGATAVKVLATIRANKQLHANIEYARQSTGKYSS